MPSDPGPVDLNRANLSAGGVASEPAPVRIVHLGLGAFHRAHQAWYTQRAGDGWGIAAFTGRSPRAAEPLIAQDGLYALVMRSADDDAVEIIASISEAHDGADLARLAELLADPAVAVVTLTVTEAGYRLDEQGGLDLDDPDVQADLRALRAASTSRSRRSGEMRSVTGERPRISSDLRISRAAEGLDAPTTPLGRLVLGLLARRAAHAGGLAVVPCDNVPANGSLTRRVVVEFAARVDPDLADWIRDNVSFVSTSVDRITPAHHGEVPAVIEAGWHDRATVVTEPFSDWVLAGGFPAGRPAWQNAGARFVDDIGPWEDRKLWLLNGAHTILAVAGLTAGHTTVADAFADPACRGLVAAFWAEAVTCLPPSVEHERYRAQLAERFANPRIAHRLEQIAAECTAKVRYRIAPIAVRLRARGEDAAACADALAAWIAAVRHGVPAADREADAVRAAASTADPTGALLALVGADTDLRFVARVRALATAHV